MNDLEINNSTFEDIKHIMKLAKRLEKLLRN